MQKFLLTIVLATLCLFFKAEAQNQNTNIKPLTLGDTIPEAVWNMPLQVRNHSNGKQTTTLKEYKGKLIIIDFWATWCSPCLAMLPKTNVLQQQYGEQVQFLPITREPESKVNELIKKTGWNPMQQLSYVIADTTLNQLFPHTYIPHYVWINAKGMVQAITADTLINAGTISHMISNEGQQLTLKADDMQKGFNINKTLIDQEAGIDTNLHYAASLSSYRKGWPSMMHFGSGTFKNRRLLIINNPMVNLFRTAYAGKAYTYTPGGWYAGYPYNRTITELKDPGYWLKPDQMYCYEQLLPDSSIEHSNQFMQQQLELMLPLKARLEKRAMPCYILVRAGKVFSHISATDTIIQYSPLHLLMRNQNSGKLTEVLNHYLGGKKHIIIDETGINTPISLELKIQLANLETVTTALLPWGFTLKPATRHIEVLVITDKNPK